MAKKLKVGWTDQSLKDANNIADWISRKFSEKEVENFVDLLRAFEEIVSNFPEMYPTSKIKSPLKQAVLHKNLSVFYQLHKKSVVVIGMKDNRRAGNI